MHEEQYDIYLAAPLFNAMELDFNRNTASMLRSCGYKVYLPQEHGKCADEKDNRLTIFTNDVKALQNSKWVVAVLDGIVTDPGVCWELGYACAESKLVVSYSTDKRSFMNGHWNNMIDISKGICFDSIYDIIEFIKHQGRHIHEGKI